jgi:hypothetical protein
MSLIGLELIVIAILMKEPKRGGEWDDFSIYAVGNID